MTDKIVLTEAEKMARDMVLLHAREASHLPCDDEVSVSNVALPSWYDEAKYKRGQQYFQENRGGIMYSNLIGLIGLLAEPRGLSVLKSTGRSSTSKTARKRYVSTIVHTLNWYNYDLSPGSKSIESIRKVRKLHYLSSKAAISKNIGFINQAELAVTAFGFMGLALTRPHLLGIQHDNQEDQEAFVHVWAVLSHMLGVQERFNICLLPFDALTIYCKMFLRYVLIPIIQFETPDFQHMTRAMLNGMKNFIPAIDYEIEYFFAKRLIGVPGYQYNTDKTKEVLCRSILTQDDVDEINKQLEGVNGDLMKPYISVDIPIIEVKRNTNDEHFNLEKEYSEMENYIRENLQLGPNDSFSIKYINYEREWHSVLNDSKLKGLSWIARGTLSFKHYLYSFSGTAMGQYFMNGVMGVVLNGIKKANYNDHTNTYTKIQSL